jgi:hypothetical protein
MMILKNHSFDYFKEPFDWIIKEPSANLFNFDELTLREMIGYIRSGARFLFANLKTLILDYAGVNTRITYIDDTIVEFKQNCPQLDSIEIKHLRTKTINFDMLAEHRIRSVSLSPKTGDAEITDRLDRMKNNFSHLLELSLPKIDLNLLNENSFDFCAPTLHKLMIPSVNTFKQGLFTKLCDLRELKMKAEVDKKTTDSDVSLFDLFIEDALKSMPRLEHLSLMLFPLRHVQTLTSQNLSELTRLSLVSVGIETLTPESFITLANLTFLDLSCNKIDQIKPGAFRGLSKLTHLNVCRTLLWMLEPGVFAGLENLTHLKMSENNDLQKITSGVFKDTPNVADIDFHECAFTWISENVFSGLQKLTRLNLNMNKIGRGEPTSFDDMPSLEYLDLGHNRFRYLRVACAPKKINISHNYRLEVVDFTSSDLSTLEFVDMSETHRQLENFDLMFDENESVGVERFEVSFEALGLDAVFNHMPRLRELRIAKKMYGSSVRLCSRAFHGLDKLEFLELDFSVGLKQRTKEEEEALNGRRYMRKCSNQFNNLHCHDTGKI